MDWSVDLRLLLPELILAVLALLLVGVDLASKRSKRPVVIVGVIGTIAALAAVVANFGQPPSDIWGNQLRHDPFASFFKLVLLVILGLVFLSAGGFLERNRMHTGEFYVLTTLATLGGILMASSYDLITIYVGLELLAVSSYVLAGMLKRDERSHEASIKMFLNGAVSSAVALFGISLLFGLSGSTNLTVLAAAIPAMTAGQLALLAAGGLLLLAGIGVKVAAVPFHMWAPDTYDGAPTPVSAYLITASEMAAFAFLVRLFLVGLPDLAVKWQLLFALIALVTMTFGNVVALVQQRIKRMLAYSAIAQAGYIFVGLAVGTPDGVSALLFYAFAYALMTLGAFAVVIHISNRFGAEEIDDFKGLSRRTPAVSFAMTVLLLSLVGIPGTAGFLGKFLLFRASVDVGLTWLGAAIVLNSALSAGYYFRVIRNMYLRDGDTTPVPSEAAVAAVLVLTVAATVVFGLYPEPLVHLVQGIDVGP